MNINRKKISKYNGLAETFYVGGITGLYNYAYHLIEKGGIYTLPLMPLMELLKFSMYVVRTQEETFTDSRLKTAFNLVFKGLKVLAAGAGAGLAVAGLATIGFGVMILSGYASVARNLYKAARSAIDGKPHKVANNLQKAAISGLISGGFTLMTFFPPFAWIGGIMVLIATGHLALSMVPSLIGELVQPPPAQDQAQPAVKPGERPNHVGGMYRPGLHARAAKPFLGASRKHRNSF